MNRCGIHWSKLTDIVELSKQAAEAPGIVYRGLMGYD
eukprot:SAG31_NODE_29154_length_400_cov_0.627907_1_plen_36_part_10